MRGGKASPGSWPYRAGGVWVRLTLFKPNFESFVLSSAVASGCRRFVQYNISASPLANVKFVDTPHRYSQKLTASLRYDDMNKQPGADPSANSVASYHPT